MIEVYDPLKHEHLLESWRADRDDITPHPSWLPTGFVSYLGTEPRAMGFIYLDSTVGVGHLDWFATSPGLTPGQAEEAMAEVLEAMESYGKSLFPGAFAMLGCVRSQAMANRAVRNCGFTPIGQTNMIAKGVEPWPQKHCS